MEFSGSQPAAHRFLRASRLAERHNGVITVAELLACDLTRRQIECLAARGLLHRIHRGVYAFGHRAIGWDGRARAAVLAAGPDALLSHRSAAAHRGLLAWDANARLEVLAPHSSRRRDVVVRRTEALRPEDRDCIRGVPVTSLNRALIDLAAAAPEPQVRVAVRQAQVRGGLLREEFHARLDLAAGQPGTPLLRSLVPRTRTPDLRSSAELDYLEILRHHDVPLPEINALVDPGDGGPPVLIDAWWARYRLAVELDSEGYHANSVSFVDDRRRDRRLTLVRIVTHRFAVAELSDGPRVAADTRRLLENAERLLAA